MASSPSRFLNYPFLTELLARYLSQTSVSVQSQWKNNKLSISAYQLKVRDKLGCETSLKRLDSTINLDHSHICSSAFYQPSWDSIVYNPVFSDLSLTQSMYQN